MAPYKFAALFIFCFVSFSFSQQRDVLFRTSDECSSIPSPNIRRQCISATSMGRIFKVQLQEQTQDNPFPEDRGRLVHQIPEAGMDQSQIYDSSFSIAISGEDTTRTLTITKHVDIQKTQSDINSISGSLFFIAVMDGVAFALGVITLIVAIAK